MGHFSVLYVVIAFLIAVYIEPIVAQPVHSCVGMLRHGLFESPSSRRVGVTVLEDRLEPFYHGVASGDPTSSAVILWTRVTPRNADTSIDVRWVVALDTGLTQVVAQGTAKALQARDFTVKIDVTGLQSNTVYYYAFQAYSKVSLIGRTRTFPVTGGDHARLAVVSCSNYPAGYFNAYGAIAKRNDIDAVLHLGDYIYEYSADSTSFAGTTGKQLGRLHSPANEIVSLADYRARYSQYRLDPDLRALHQQHPIIHIYDDHESANDSYTDGAENHQPNEGEWTLRRDISKRACYEWMPTREQVNQVLYRSIQYGDLLDITMLDTRLDGRDKQIEDLGDDASAASKAALADPKRKLISQDQFSWLTSTLAASTTTWHVLGNQVLFTEFNVTPIDTNFMFRSVGPLYAAILRPQVPTLQNLIESGFYGDVWSKYPAPRAMLCNTLQSQNVKNVIVTTGDFHCSFATDIEQTWKKDTNSVGVEFVTPSVTSPNFDENLSTQAFLRPILKPLLETLDSTLYGLNNHLHWCDIVNHGYLILDVTPTVAQADWYFVPTVLERSTNEVWSKGYTTANRSSGAIVAGNPAQGKSQQDLPAPPNPPSVTLNVEQADPSYLDGFTLLSFGPMPTSSVLTLTLHASESRRTDISVFASSGAVNLRQSIQLSAGVSTLALDLVELPQGQYMVALTQGERRILLPIVVKK